MYDAVNAVHHRKFEPFYYSGSNWRAASDEAAAAALISERIGDGLRADVPYTPGSGPGVWEPNPPSAPPMTPWLGQMRPFTMRSAEQFLPDGPNALARQEWVADYNLTRLLGDADSTLRTPGQTEIGLFWTAHTESQYSRAFDMLAQYYKRRRWDRTRRRVVVSRVRVAALMSADHGHI